MTRNRTYTALTLALAAALSTVPTASAQTSVAAGTVTKVVYTNKAQFEAALDALAPGSRRNINWDAVPVPANSTIAIPADFFLASRQIILDPDFPADELLVSNDEFGDLNANYPENFPFFSPQINFKYKEDDGQPNVFRLADLKTPGAISGFGVIFTDVERANASGLEFLDSEGNEIDTVYATPGPNGGQQFLGVIYSKPVVAEVDVLMGQKGDEFGEVEDLTNGGSADVVVVDDFVFQAATTAIPEIDAVHFGPTGALKVSGLGFQLGAQILVNGEAQITKNNKLHPATRLSSKAAGAAARGQSVTLQVLNPDGTVSKAVRFDG